MRGTRGNPLENMVEAWRCHGGRVVVIWKDTEPVNPRSWDDHGVLLLTGPGLGGDQVQPEERRWLLSTEGQAVMRGHGYAIYPVRHWRNKDDEHCLLLCCHGEHVDPNGVKSKEVGVMMNAGQDTWERFFRSRGRLPPHSIEKQMQKQLSHYQCYLNGYVYRCTAYSAETGEEMPGATNKYGRNTDLCYYGRNFKYNGLYKRAMVNDKSRPMTEEDWCQFTERMYEIWRSRHYRTRRAM